MADSTGEPFLLTSSCLKAANAPQQRFRRCLLIMFPSGSGKGTRLQLNWTSKLERDRIQLETDWSRHDSYTQTRGFARSAEFKKRRGKAAKKESTLWVGLGYESFVCIYMMNLPCIPCDSLYGSCADVSKRHCRWSKVFLDPGRRSQAVSFLVSRRSM